jgi:hypothetical protein
MFRPFFAWLLLIPIALQAGDDAWKTKRAADWTDSDTKQILTESPWGVMVTPTVNKKQEQSKQGNRGIAVAGVPGMNRRRNQQPREEAAAAQSPEMPRPFNLRWESALPIREAELKARETNAPAVDEDHYAVAVYGIPAYLAKDPKSLGDHLKGQCTIKVEGQKDLKPSSVDVIPREDGVVIVFLFPKVKEIAGKDSRAEFNAQIGPFQFTQPFHLDQMIYQGKTEL